MTTKKKTAKALFAANLQVLLDRMRVSPPDGETREDWSNAALARRIGVVRSVVTRWLDGDSVPHADMMDKLAAVFDVPVMRFFIDPDTDLMTPEDALEALQRVVREARQVKRSKQ